MTTFAVTVCELPDNTDDFDTAWNALVAHQATKPADLVVLNEVPFDAWFGTSPTFDASRWQTAVARHRRGLERLRGLGTAVLGTAPYDGGRQRYNRAFLHRPDRGLSWWRRKSWLPDEEPVWEASWYSSAPDRPDDLRSVGACRLGVLTCTELWAMDWAKQLGMAGAQVIASPRASGAGSTDNWLAAGRVSALVSGCYSLSSNRSGGGFGGAGWVFAPDGECLTVTSDSEPFATVTIDLRDADSAKQAYPRYALWTERW